MSTQSFEILLNDLDADFASSASHLSYDAGPTHKLALSRTVFAEVKLSLLCLVPA